MQLAITREETGEEISCAFFLQGEDRYSNIKCKLEKTTGVKGLTEAYKIVNAQYFKIDILKN